MGFSQDYPNVPDWVAKPEGYPTGSMVKYNGNIFYANFSASEPGVGDAAHNGWRFYDELYDLTPHTPTAQAKIIAYIPTWRKKEKFNYANDEMYRYITHGIVSFLMFSEVNLGEFEPKSLDEVKAILSDVINTGHRNGTRISIALGGAVDYGFLNLMTSIGNNPDNPLLNQAVQNVVNFVNLNNLDGVDLDLECWWDRNGDPSKDQGGRLTSQGAHPAGSALTLFAQKLKQAMPDKLVSAAIFGTSYYGNNYDPKLADYVDWLGIMTYDLTGSWNASPVGPHTTLYKIRNQESSNIRTQDSYQESYVEEQQGEWPNGGIVNNPILSVEDTLWYWTNPLFVNWQGAGQNIPRNKIAAGVPIYGYDFAYGKDPDDLSGEVPPGYKSIRYKDILAQFPDAHTAANGNIKVSGSTPRPPFISASGNYPYTHNIYFETPDTAVTKLNFLKDVGAQGVIIWELSNDIWEEGKSIIKALYQNSGNPESRTPIPALSIIVGSAPVPKYRIVNVKSRMAITAPTNKGEGVYQSPVDSSNPLQVFEIQKDIENTNIRCAGNPSLVLDVQGDSGNDQTPIIVWTENGNLGQRFRFEKLTITGSGPPPTHETDWVGQYLIHPNSFFLNPTSFRLAVSGGSTETNAAIVQDAQFGVFGVSLEDDQKWYLYEVANDVSSPWIEVRGENSYCYCVCNRASSKQQGAISHSHTMNIEAGAPYFYAVLTKDDDTVDFPTGAILTIQDPDGNNYDRDIQEENLLVIMSGSSVRCLIVKDPKPGNWTMTMTVPAGVGFHCECNTVPSKDVYDTITTALSTTNQLQKRGVVALGMLGLAMLVKFYLEYNKTKNQDIKLVPELVGAAVESPTSIALDASGATPTRSNSEMATTLAAAASITSTRTPLVTEGDALQQYLNGRNENDNTGTFEILDQNGTSTTYTSYLQWIAAIRPRLGGNGYFAVRLQLPDSQQSPWIRIQASDFYLEAFSTADNPFVNGNWQGRDIPENLIPYPDPSSPENAPTVSFDSINQGAIPNANNWMNGTTDTLNHSTVVILIFVISEAARFDGVAFAVDRVLSQFATYNWYYFRPLLNLWDPISNQYYNTERHAGVSVRAAGQMVRRRPELQNDLPRRNTLLNYLVALVRDYGYPSEPNN